MFAAWPIQHRLLHVGLKRRVFRCLWRLFLSCRSWWACWTQRWPITLFNVCICQAFTYLCDVASTTWALEAIINSGVSYINVVQTLWRKMFQCQPTTMLNSPKKPHLNTKNMSQYVNKVTRIRGVWGKNNILWVLQTLHTTFHKAHWLEFTTQNKTLYVYECN